ncbi:MAG: hypothetical protein WCF73_01135, partial [Candidatus Sulfotelmatobacter sp.]
ATTTIHRTAAHPWAFMVRAISITASSWAWAHGRTGAMATAGVVIASAVEAEDATSPAVETAADVGMQPIVDVARRQYALAAVAVASIPQQRVVAYPIARPMPQQRVVAYPMVRPMLQHHVVARHMVLPMPQQRVVAPLTVAVADRMVAANTISPWLLNLAAQEIRSGGA